MWLKNISILNFKNIGEASVDFCEGVNCLVGANGMGKSNMLEAVYYLSMTRSFLRLPDAEVMRRGSEAMMVKGEYALDAGRADTVSIGYTPPHRKVLKRGGKEYKRFSSHIGTLPVVLISPQDHFLITGSPEDRRRLMDSVISQADSLYLEALMRYARLLQQRNSMLKTGMADPLLTEGIEQAMDAEAAVIVQGRREWLKALAEPFSHYYRAIAGTSEEPLLEYRPSLGSMSLREALAQSRAKDSIVGFTTVGPHRDDLAMLLSGRELKRFGSQGQMKTFTIALRMAIYEYLNTMCGYKPLLLLDDIFDKLDAGRVANIMQLVSSSERFGQIFITDTGRENIDATLERVEGSYRLFGVESGAYSLLKSGEP